MLRPSAEKFLGLLLRSGKSIVRKSDFRNVFTVKERGKNEA